MKYSRISIPRSFPLSASKHSQSLIVSKLTRRIGKSWRPSPCPLLPARYESRSSPVAARCGVRSGSEARSRKNHPPTPWEGADNCTREERTQFPPGPPMYVCGAEWGATPARWRLTDGPLSPPASTAKAVRLARRRRHRRGALELICQAIREGWLDGNEHSDRRDRLVATLCGLLNIEHKPTRKSSACAKRSSRWSGATWIVSLPLSRPNAPSAGPTFEAGFARSGVQFPPQPRGVFLRGIGPTPATQEPLSGVGCG